jgi:hypothetical protein
VSSLFLQTKTFGLNSFACFAKSSIFCPPAKISTSKLNLLAISSAFTPIEPVEPRSISITPS